MNQLLDIDKETDYENKPAVIHIAKAPDFEYSYCGVKLHTLCNLVKINCEDCLVLFYEGMQS